MAEPMIWTEPRDQEVLVRAEDLRNYVKTLYLRAGVPEPDAETMAKLQTETDVRGVHSHGTRAAPRYVRRILEGQTNPKPRIQIVKEGPAFTVFDNDGGMGHLGSVRAMEAAIAKASENGIGAATVVHSRHFGAAFNYAMMAADRDMIGFAVSSSSPGVAPFGGTARVVGNNPVAHAVPALEEFPLVLDMACGVSAWGRVGTMRMYGKRLTRDWVLDRDGNPTDDPHKAHVLLPFGNVKGSGLAIIMDVFSSVLPFCLATPHRDGAYAEQRDASHFFQAVDISKFTAVDEFKAEIDRMVRTVRGSRRRPDVDRIYLPGEIEWLKKKAWMKSGIPLHQKHVQSLEQIGEELGVSERLPLRASRTSSEVRARPGNENS